MAARDQAPDSDARAQEAILVGAGALRERALAALARSGLPAYVLDSLDQLAAAWRERPAAVAVVVGRVAQQSLTRALARGEGRTVLVRERVTAAQARSALAAGAAGVVAAKDIDTALAPCVRAVAAGQACVPQARRRQLRRPALSARERQVLGMVVMGYMNGEIAQRMFLSESTVKSHLSSAFAKLGVRSRYEAAEVILDRDRGAGLGILSLGAEPVALSTDAAR